jgi:hypothetical protein
MLARLQQIAMVAQDVDCESHCGTVMTFFVHHLRAETPGHDVKLISEEEMKNTRNMAIYGESCTIQDLLHELDRSEYIGVSWGCIFILTVNQHGLEIMVFIVQSQFSIHKEGNQQIHHL